MTQNRYETGRHDLPFVGNSTFGQNPYVADWGNIDADHAILGAPYDFGTQWWSGVHFGSENPMRCTAQIPMNTIGRIVHNRPPQRTSE